MKKYNIQNIDTHTHTYYSFDCFDNPSSPEQMCASALSKGLDAIILTDHLEINSEAEGLYAPFEADKRKRACEDVKKKYAGILDVYIGVELGQITQYPQLADKYIKQSGFEYITGSIHNVKNEKDFYYMDFSRISDTELFDLIDRYFDEYYDMTCFDCIDQCAHITYPLRYCYAAGKNIDIRSWEEKILRILDNIVKTGKTLEFNTNCMRRGIPMPDEYILSLYKSVGGKKLSLGSDAHFPDDIKADFDRAYSIINKIFTTGEYQ